MGSLPWSLTGNPELVDIVDEVQLVLSASCSLAVVTPALCCRSG